uniref:Uncharacterized protein n=1 Tax=Oryza rufipogon TaxID=4529 RepID=A0A0E0PWQ1_ORYRU
MAPLGGTLRLCGSSWEEATSAGAAEQAAGLTGGGGRSSIALVGEGSAMERDEEWSECYGVNVVVEDFDNVGYGGVPGQQNSGAGFSSTKRMTSHMSAIVVVKSTVTSVALVLSLWYRTQSSCSHKNELVPGGMSERRERASTLATLLARSSLRDGGGSSDGSGGGLGDSGGRRLGRQRRRWARATLAAVGSTTAVAWGSVAADPVVGKAAAADPAMRRVAVTDPEAVGSATAVAGGSVAADPVVGKAAAADPAMRRVAVTDPEAPTLGLVIPSVVVALLRPLICDADAIISAVRATQVPDQTKLINAIKEAGGDHVRR